MEEVLGSRPFNVGSTCDGGETEEDVRGSRLPTGLGTKDVRFYERRPYRTPTSYPLLGAGLRGTPVRASSCLAYPVRNDC